MNGGYSTVRGNNIMMHLKDHDIRISIDIKHDNIPVITYVLLVVGRNNSF